MAAELSKPRRIFSQKSKLKTTLIDFSLSKKKGKKRKKKRDFGGLFHTQDFEGAQKENFEPLGSIEKKRILSSEVFAL